MSDILDELRVSLDSAFERAEHDRRRRRVLMVLAPVAVAALACAAVVAYLPTREGIPADERAVPAVASPAPPFARNSPVSANVQARSPDPWHERVRIDKGLADGIHRGDPVIDGAGLVGTVAESSRDSSAVALITDPSFATSAYVGRARRPGSVTSTSASPDELLFESVDASAEVRAGDLVYTAGTIDPALRSRYPRGVPIGRVTRVELRNGDLDRRISVAPAADLGRLGIVQVLTDPHGSGTSRAGQQGTRPR